MFSKGNLRHEESIWGEVMSKADAVLTLMDRTLKYLMTAGLVIVVGFGLLFLIGYIIYFTEKSLKTRKNTEFLHSDRKKEKRK